MSLPRTFKKSTLSLAETTCPNCGASCVMATVAAVATALVESTTPPSVCRGEAWRN